MSFVQRDQVLSEWLKHEYRPELNYCHDEVVLLASGTDGVIREVKSGMVVGKITASGKYTRIDHTKADGSQNAAGICYFTASTENTDGKMVILNKGPAIVSEKAVDYNTTDPTKLTATKTALEALGIRIETTA